LRLLPNEMGFHNQGWGGEVDPPEKAIADVFESSLLGWAPLENRLAASQQIG
jgi:hypothetical protein